MPSLTYGVVLGWPEKSRSLFVEFSVKSNGASPSQEKMNSPSSECVALTALIPAAALTWLRSGFPAALLDFVIQSAQSFRNQSVGRR
jgi:hypothetical protein